MTDIEGRLPSVSSDPPFRPAKRRRHYRKRGDDLEPGDVDTVSIPEGVGAPPDPLEPGGPAPRPEDSPNQHDGDQRPSAKLVQLRRPTRHHRRTGIEFANGLSHPPGGRGPRSSPPPPDAAVDRDETTADVAAMVNRFAPQTGQVADVNKHMMAYIDSELAKLRQADPDHDPTGNAADDAAAPRTARPGYLPRQPAALGKLHEIDLGPDVKLSNIAKTEAAKKRLEAGHADAADVAMDDDRTKGRLGRHGKPWRGRKRRTSDDVRRDQLVEEVLRESKLELYDEPEPILNANDVQAADDRIAEKFRRDFLDAISSRHRRRGPPANSAAAKAKREERPKGPKLGGSRSARAAMREQQNKTKPTAKR
ncbi:MAG: hypothetical protein M1826_001002 [Phylliscum demangeonii]|nr:MAG: hypothetical protein M1826_001002 [Phylliscum demangeonii]